MFRQLSHVLDCCNLLDLGFSQLIRRIVDAARGGGPPAASNPFALDGTIQQANSGGASSLALPAYTSTYGNDVVLVCIEPNGGPVTSITGGGLSFSRIPSFSPPANIDVWYAIASSPLSSVVFTVNQTGAAFITASVRAVSGAKTSAPFDAVTTASNTSGNPYPTVTTDVANTIAFGCAANTAANPLNGFANLFSANFQMVDYKSNTTTLSGVVWDSSSNNPSVVWAIVKGP